MIENIYFEDMKKINTTYLFGSLTLMLFAFSSFLVFAQESSFDTIAEADVRVYKTVDGYDLKINIFKPNTDAKGKHPAIVFFFGGGWKNGNVNQFAQHCKYLASKGMVAMAANYRVASRNNSSPFDAVEDAKSAIRWIREHAKELGVQKNKIVAAGGSAGGHLAVSTALIPGNENERENLKISSVPNALILFNPAVNTTSERFTDRFGDRAQELSPSNYVVPKLPPTIIFHGTDDTIVPFETITDFQSKMEAAGNTCYVVPFEGQGHGFFNFGRNDNRFYDLTIEKTESFLWEIKYLK